MNVRQLRVVRWVQVTGLALSAGDAALMLDRGHLALAAVPAVLIIIWSLLICMQTRVIRVREALDRPRPDYSAIARMEREVYGETFEHGGAPAVARPVRMVAGQTAMCKRCMTPYARSSGFCSRCYRTHKEAARS